VSDSSELRHAKSQPVRQCRHWRVLQRRRYRYTWRILHDDFRALTVKWRLWESKPGAPGGSGNPQICGLFYPVRLSVRLPRAGSQRRRKPKFGEQLQLATDRRTTFKLGTCPLISGRVSGTIYSFVLPTCVQAYVKIILISDIHVNVAIAHSGVAG